MLKISLFIPTGLCGTKKSPGMQAEHGISNNKHVITLQSHTWRSTNHNHTQSISELFHDNRIMHQATCIHRCVVNENHGFKDSIRTLTLSCSSLHQNFIMYNHFISFIQKGYSRGKQVIKITYYGSLYFQLTCLSLGSRAVGVKGQGSKSGWQFKISIFSAKISATL